MIWLKKTMRPQLAGELRNLFHTWRGFILLMNQMKESINIMNYIFRSTSSSFQKKKRNKHDDPRHKIEEVENLLQSSLIRK